MAHIFLEAISNIKTIESRFKLIRKLKIKYFIKKTKKIFLNNLIKTSYTSNDLIDLALLIDRAKIVGLDIDTKMATIQYKKDNRGIMSASIIDVCLFADESTSIDINLISTNKLDGINYTNSASINIAYTKSHKDKYNTNKTLSERYYISTESISLYDKEYGYIMDSICKLISNLFIIVIEQIIDWMRRTYLYEKKDQ